MPFIDMRTLVFNQTLSFALCAGVLVLLWLQNRRRFAGLGFWVADYVMHTGTMLLFTLRGIVPVWVSVIVGNALLLGGVTLFYIGLERFFDRRSNQLHNGLLFVLSLAIHGYFTVIQPNLAARNINISVGVLILCLQTLWLLLHRVGDALRPITRWVALTFVGYCLIGVGRIAVNVVAPPGNDFLRDSGQFDTFMFLLYQMLSIAVTFELFLMLNHRLFLELTSHQDALQESEARYRQLVELSPDAVCVYCDDIIVFVNPAAVALMGATDPDDLLGRAILDFVHPDYHQLAQMRIGNALTKGETAPLLEEKLIRFDGTVIDIEATTAPLVYQGRDALQTLIRDITERKQAEGALHRYAEQLAVQNAELDAFAQTVAHDLKNPLGLIIGYANFMEEERATLSTSELDQAIEVILRSGKKLNTIIDELLLLSGVRNEVVPSVPLAMTVIVQEALARLDWIVAQTQAEVAVPDPDTWPVVLGHAQWVEEVWANYISNALKYGGTPPRVELGWDWATDETTVRFWVRDNGDGLTTESQVKLFTPFTRLGQVRAQGHGLGLSIVQRIVEKLGGEVGVESAVGEGSRFWFTLPAA